MNLKVQGFGNFDSRSRAQCLSLQSVRLRIEDLVALVILSIGHLFTGKL